MGAFQRGQRPRRGGTDRTWVSALLALVLCDSLWPGPARCEAKDVCMGLNEQQYYCESGHCCGDNGCCTYYYELWWFWLLWTLVVVLCCCCAYRHRRSKLRSHQRARQRRIDMLAYRGACNYPGPPLDIRLMAVCKLPPYEEAILTQADTSPPPPYSELGPQQGPLNVEPPLTASSDSSFGGAMVILHRADSSPEAHTDPSDYRPSPSPPPPPAPPPPSPPSPSSPAATTATWSATSADEGDCAPQVMRDPHAPSRGPEEEEAEAQGEEGGGERSGGEACDVQPRGEKEVAVDITTTPTAASPANPNVTASVTPNVTPNVTPSVTPSMTPSLTPNVTESVTPSLTPTVTPRTGSGKKRARFCPRLDVTVEMMDGEETTTRPEEPPGNQGDGDGHDADGGGGGGGCGDYDDDDGGEETDHFRHRRLTGDSGIDVRPPDPTCDDDEGDDDAMEKEEEVVLARGKLGAEPGAKAYGGGQTGAPQSSQLARTP